MSGDDRAQLIVIAALVLALVLVGLALVLNSAIFAGNIATRETNQDSRAAAEQRAAVDEAVGRAIHHVNVHDPAAPNENLTAELAAVNERFQVEAMRGEVVTIDVTGRTNGTRIAQTNASRTFAAGGAETGTPDWTVVEGIEGTQQFDMLVTTSSLYDADEGTTWNNISDNAFRITVTGEDGTTWRVYLYRSSVTGNAYLVTGGPSGVNLADDDSLFATLEESCVASGSAVTVGFVQALFDSDRLVATTTEGITAKPHPRDGTRTRCSELGFYDPAANYTISFGNADAAAGRYELLAAASNASVDSRPFHGPSDGASPFVHEAIWRANLSMHYRTTEVGYQVNWSTDPRADRIRLDEQPEIDRLNVTNESVNEDRVQYDVEWAASDPSGNLAAGTVYLYNTDEGRLAESKQITVAGGSGNGSVTVADPSGDSGDEYSIRLEIEDESRQADSGSLTDVADGQAP